MKKSDIQKVREMDESELNTRLKDLKIELFNLRFQHAINQLDNPLRLNFVRKEIAVVKTIIRENAISAASKA